MKPIKSIIYAVCVLSVGLWGGCKEELNVTEVMEEAPVIEAFTPQSGKVGTPITLTGAHLKNVTQVFMGDVPLELKYKISGAELVAVVTGDARGGKIRVKSPKGEAESPGEYVVVYPVPEMVNLPQSAKVGESMEIIGTDMDVVTRVLFKDVKAEIVYQNSSELIVNVPFVLDDHIALTFVYPTETGEEEIMTEADGFEVVKPRPVVNEGFPADVKEGQLIRLTGENLNLVEKVLFGEIEAPISVKESGRLDFRVPTLPATASVPVVCSYYDNTASLALSEACRVFIPEVFHYEDIVLGAHRAESGNLFNAVTGEVLTPCALKEPILQSQIDFAGYINGSYSFTIYGPQATASTMKNYWCDGKSFTKSTTMDALIAEGYGDFLATVTKFKVLSEGNPDEKGIVDLVKSGQLERLTPETVPALFNGTITAEKESIRTKKKGSEEAASDQIFEEGSVIFFKNQKRDRIGLMYVKRVNVNFDVVGADMNSLSNMIFDVYFERK